MSSRAMAGMLAALCAAGILGAAAFSVSAARAETELPAFDTLFGGPFALTDHDGVARTDADYHGTYVLIYFGYTFCPDICPTNLLEIANAIDQLGARAEEVLPMFVTLDPARDTPMVMKDYVANFGERFVGLTGTEAEIAMIAQAYRLHRVKVLPEWSQSEGDYLVDHSSLIFLLGPDGKVLTLFPHETGAQEIAARTLSYIDGTPDS